MNVLKSGANFSHRITTVFSIIFCILFVLVSPVSAEGAWVGGWDTLANQDSPIFLPTDLAVDSNRTVYVIDNYASAILKRELSSSSWSYLPNQPFQLGQDWLVGIAVDSANNIYVLNGNNGSSDVVWKFDGTTWTDITKSTFFDYPISIAVDQNQNVYVASKYDYSATVKFTHIRKLVNGQSNWSVIGNWDNGGFESIVAITTDINNYVYAIEAVEFNSVLSGRLRRLAPGTTSWSFYPTGDTVSMLKQPNDIAVDRYGNIYVTDHNTQELHVFAKNATMWAQIRKDSNLKFTDIYSVAVDNKGYVYVSDPAFDVASPNRRIYRHQPWATQLIWQTQPSGTVGYQTISPSPVLSMSGPDNDLITGVNTNAANVFLTVPNGATLGGTQYRTFNNGKATFTDLSVDKAGTYTLTGNSTIASTNIMNAVWAFPDVDLSKVSSQFTITPPPKAATPTANPPSGATVFNNSFITLSSTTAGAHFHYTTNGTTPTGSSPSGSQVLINTVSGTSITVKAIASAATYADSDVATFTYTIQHRQFLPLISR